MLREGWTKLVGSTKKWTMLFRRLGSEWCCNIFMQMNTSRQKGTSFGWTVELHVVCLAHLLINLSRHMTILKLPSIWESPFTQIGEPWNKQTGQVAELGQICFEISFEICFEIGPKGELGPIRTERPANRGIQTNSFWAKGPQCL